MNTQYAQLQTVAQFAAVCQNLSSDGIYELFENEISEILRDRILGWSLSDSAEPVRDALNRIGRMTGVESLEKY